MNGIVIGASNESQHAIIQAEKLGMHVIAFDGDESAKGLSIADEAYVVDIREPENIYTVIDGKNISHDMVVIPVPIGRYLTSTGSFNDHYNLIGAKRQTTEICTDKWLFHQTLNESCNEHKLRNISCSLLKAGEMPNKPKSFPVIIKPRFGAGSREVKQISSEAEWADWRESVALPFDEDFIIEDAVSGTEYGIDGMVINSEFHLILTRKKINTLPPYRQCVGYISATAGDINSKLSQYMEKLISVIKLDNGILHADLIYDGQTAEAAHTAQEPFVIEMSARPSGHRLHDIFTPLVTGVDMVREYLKYAISGKFDISAVKQDAVFMIRYFDIEAEIKRIPDKEHLFSKYPIFQYECNLKQGETARIIDGHSLMDRGFFILKGKSEKELCKVADNILAEYV